MIKSKTGLISNNDLIYKLKLKCEGVIVYINYTKATESKVDMLFYAKESKVSNDFYNIIMLDGLNIKKLSYNITESGKYRIPLALGKNEDFIKINFSFVDPTAEEGLIIVDVIEDHIAR